MKESKLSQLQRRMPCEIGKGATPGTAQVFETAWRTAASAFRLSGTLRDKKLLSGHGRPAQSSCMPLNVTQAGCKGQCPMDFSMIGMKRQHQQADLASIPDPIDNCGSVLFFIQVHSDVTWPITIILGPSQLHYHPGCY